MSGDRIEARGRAAAAARAGWGCFLLLAPARYAGLGSAAPVPAGAVMVVRVLGARQVVQAAVTAAAPPGAAAALSASVDALHAGSCVGMAAAWPRWRGPALTDALIGAALAAVAWSCRR